MINNPSGQIKEGEMDEQRGKPLEIYNQEDVHSVEVVGSKGIAEKVVILLNNGQSLFLTPKLFMDSFGISPQMEIERMLWGKIE